MTDCTPVPKPVREPKEQKRYMTTKRRKKAVSDRSERIHNCPCMICHYYGMQQLSPTAEHHWYHDRPVPGRKTSDSETLPLCEGHHQGLIDNSKIALHLGPETWRKAYGRDYDWLKYANELIEEYN